MTQLEFFVRLEHLLTRPDAELRAGVEALLEQELKELEEEALSTMEGAVIYGPF